MNISGNGNGEPDEDDASFQSPRGVRGEPLRARGGNVAKGGMAGGYRPGDSMPHPVPLVGGRVPGTGR